MHKRTIGMAAGLGVLVSMVASFCLAAERAALTDQEQKAQMPADLGKPTIDVSHYPAEMQKNYQVFQKTCSSCHTPARAVYSSFTSHEQWEHYVSLMNGRFLSRKMSPEWKVEDGRRIIDFLVCDSQVRKIDQRPVFQEECRQLAIRFEEVKKRKAEQNKHQPIQPSAPYTGANP